MTWFSTGSYYQWIQDTDLQAIDMYNMGELEPEVEQTKLKQIQTDLEVLLRSFIDATSEVHLIFEDNLQSLFQPQVDTPPP